jgi:hypothetical protein
MENIRYQRRFSQLRINSRIHRSERKQIRDASVIDPACHMNLSRHVSPLRRMVCLIATFPPSDDCAERERATWMAV